MLPIPAFAALILGWLAVRQVLLGRRWLAGFLALCALQSGMTALAMGYGITSLRVVMPVTAVMIPPLAWVTFRRALFGPSPMLVHLAGPLFITFARIFAPQTVDVAVSVVFLVYGVAIWLTLFNVPDLPLPRIGAGSLPARLWRAIGTLLIASALGDGLIALAYASGHQAWAGWLISLFASGTLVAIGLIGTAPEAVGEADVPSPLPALADADDAATMTRLDAFLHRDKVYLDPDLSLQRLARRLHLPEKRLSMAVNRVTGGNVSRYINGWRIEHACGLIGTGQSITEAMLASGFNTKSNFNREFLRIKGQSPSEWASAARLALGKPERDAMQL